MAVTQITLLPGEEVAFEIEAPIFTTFNPLQLAIQKLTYEIGKIFGSKNNSKLIVTTQRILISQEIISCYCIPIAKLSKVIMPSSVKEVGFREDAMLFGLLKSHVFFFQGLTELFSIVLKKSDEATLAGYTAKFYAALNAK